MPKKPCKIQIKKHQISPENDTLFPYVHTRLRVTSQVLRPVHPYEKTRTIRHPGGSVIPAPQKSKNSEPQTPNACSYTRQTNERQNRIFLLFSYLYSISRLKASQIIAARLSQTSLLTISSRYCPPSSIHAFVTKGMSLSFCSSLLFSAVSFISPSFS